MASNPRLRAISNAKAAARALLRVADEMRAVEQERGVVTCACGSKGRGRGKSLTVRAVRAEESGTKRVYDCSHCGARLFTREYLIRVQSGPPDFVAAPRRESATDRLREVFVR